MEELSILELQDMPKYFRVFLLPQLLVDRIYIMTKIIFDIKRDNGYGKEIYASGNLTWTPAQNSTTNLLPQMNFSLGGPIEFEIPVISESMYWGVTEYVGFGGAVYQYQRFVTVPDSATPINYLDLPDVDPQSFFPENV
jgi:hypothetical protein